MTRYWTRGLTRHLIGHPFDALAVARAGWRLRRAGWWRRPPFLPLPDPRYWEFRMTTAYGTASADPSPKSLVEAARWANRQPAER
jgi:hypothetical protein